MSNAAGRRRASSINRARPPVKWRKSNLPPAVMKEVMKQLPKGAENVRVMRRGRSGKKFRVLYETGGKTISVFPWDVTNANFRLYPPGQVGAPGHPGVQINPTISPTFNPTFSPTFNPRIIVNGRERGGRRDRERETERPPPAEAHRLDPNQLDDIRRELDEAVKARGKAVNQLLGGGPAHRKFQKSMGYTRGKGLAGALLNLINPVAWWRDGPRTTLGGVYNQLSSPRTGKVSSKLRAAPYGKTFYTSGGAEAGRARRLRKVKTKDLEPNLRPRAVLAARDRWNAEVGQAFAELTHNPTAAQHQIYQKQLADANLVFDKAQDAVEREFRGRMRKKGVTSGGSESSQTRRLSRL